MKRKAFVSGLSGQDGSLLAQLLLSKGYQVFGGRRRNASGSLWRLEELGIADKVTIVPFELLELPQMIRVLRDVMPDEVYNLAAQSFVATSFDHPLYTFDVDAMGVLRLLEAVKTACPYARIYQASSSEMYGNAPACEDPSCLGCVGYDEEARMLPRSPYGIAKLAAYHAVRNYRESKGKGCLYGLFASNGILFNHESSLRSLEFVTRKITDGLARIACGQDFVLHLGNLDAKRDWSYAGDAVRAMHLILQHSEPDDFVIATGETHSVREFLTLACNYLQLPLDDLFESGKIVIDESLTRPAEVDVLIGDASKAKRVLGWEPTVRFPELVQMMVDADMARIRRQLDGCFHSREQI